MASNPERVSMWWRHHESHCGSLFTQWLSMIELFNTLTCGDQFIIKSPRYTGGDFMFLYRFVRRRRRRHRRPQILVHAITFEQILDFFHFWHDFRPWPVDYPIRFWSIFVVTLTYIFQGQIWNLLYLSQKWSDCHETKSKHINWTLGLKCDHRVWPWPWHWHWNFKVKNRISYMLAKHGPIAMKRKANISIELKASHVTIRFDLGHDLDVEFFKVKYGISYISDKSGPIAMKRKANISIELQASNVTNGFDLEHYLDLWILKVKRDLDLWPHSWPWSWIFMVIFWNSCISEWEGRLALHKGVAVGHSWPWPFGD